MSVCVQTSMWTQVSLLSGTHGGAGRRLPACRLMPRPPAAGGGPTCPHPPDAGCHPPLETAVHTGVWGTVPQPPASPRKLRVRRPLGLAGQVSSLEVCPLGPFTHLLTGPFISLGGRIHKKPRRCCGLQVFNEPSGRESSPGKRLAGALHRAAAWRVGALPSRAGPPTPRRHPAPEACWNWVLGAAPFKNRALQVQPEPPHHLPAPAGSPPTACPPGHSSRQRASVSPRETASTHAFTSSIPSTSQPRCTPQGTRE